MFALCTASVILSTSSTLPITIAQKVALHTEKIKFNFNGALNYLNYAAMLVSSTDNDIYTFKDILHQPDAQEFL